MTVEDGRSGSCVKNEGEIVREGSMEQQNVFLDHQEEPDSSSDSV